MKSLANLRVTYKGSDQLGGLLKQYLILLKKLILTLFAKNI